MKLANEGSSRPQNVQYRYHQEQKQQQQQQQPDLLFHLGRTKRTHYRPQRTFIQSRHSDSPSPSKEEKTLSLPTESSKLLNEKCIYVSPVPLPPIYLGLEPSCSQQELEDALRSVGVLSMKPIGVLETIQLTTPQPSRHHYSMAGPPSPLLNYQCRGPPPTKSDFISSPISQLPFPSEMIRFRYSPSPPPSTSFNDSSSKSALIYQQSLEALPPQVRNPANLRFVIPFGSFADHCPPFNSRPSPHADRLPISPLQRSSVLLQHHKFGHVPSCASDNYLSFALFPMRACLRTGAT